MPAEAGSMIQRCATDPTSGALRPADLTSGRLSICGDGSGKNLRFLNGPARRVPLSATLRHTVLS
jgi:hypothetical protein